ncbi:hypothetical protein, partial [Escherichia coli]|uniref:hypothetical protein n=1 Tax=Escherichia coli TaxID=562 RepID=UPI0019535E77
FWGVGIGVMRTFAPATLPKGEDQPAASVLPKAKVAVPHLSVVPDIVVPKPAKVVVPKVVKAKVVKPEIAKTGQGPAKAAQPKVAAAPA